MYFHNFILKVYYMYKFFIYIFISIIYFSTPIFSVEINKEFIFLSLKYDALPDGLGPLPNSCSSSRVRSISAKRARPSAPHIRISQSGQLPTNYRRRGHGTCGRLCQIYCRKKTNAQQQYVDERQDVAGLYILQTQKPRRAPIFLIHSR